MALNIQSIAAKLSSIYLQCSSTEISHAGKHNIRQSYTTRNLSKQEKGLKVRPGHEEPNCILERSCGKYYAMHSFVNTINYSVKQDLYATSHNQN